MAQGFCGPGNDSFLNLELWSRSDRPDLTQCFQSVVFYIVPSLFLTAVSSCRLYHLYHSQKAAHPNHWLATLQTILCVCLIVPPVAEVFRTIHDSSKGYSVYAVEYLTAIFRIGAMVLAAVIVQYERRKSARNFGGLFAYWLMLTCFGGWILYSKIAHHMDDIFRLSTFIIHYILVLTQLALTFAPHPIISKLERGNPQRGANYLSRVTFWWFNGLIVQGYRKSLEEKDLYELDDVDKSGVWLPLFEKEWQYETNKLLRKTATKASANEQVTMSAQELDNLNRDGTKLQNGKSFEEEESLIPKTLPEGVKPSLLKCLAKVFLPTLLVCVAFKLVQDLLLFVNPLLLRAIIQFVNVSTEPSWRGYVYGIMMFVNGLLISSVLQQYFLKTMVIGMRVRSVICSAVYNKSMKLTSSSKKKSTVGEVVNLMSVDAQRFMDIMTYINMLWSGPLQIIISVVMLWQLLGPSSLAGVGVMILLIPINVVIGNKNRSFQVAQMKEKDVRVKLMSEILNGVKVLKLYAWEESFKNMILKIRQRELDLIKKSGYANAFTSFFWQCAPFLVACTTFAVYVLSDDRNILTAEKAFVALSLFNIMRFPMSMVPMVISQLIQITVSVKRLANFLSLEELGSDQVDRTPHPEMAIRLQNCTFTWKDAADDQPTLSDVSLEVGHGKLVAVVGVVGSGKSSLLSGLLGDMLKLKGHAAVSGNVAYVPQQAWIQNATLKDNILFGSTYEETWYNKVVDACALRQDFQMLPAADLTEIGEKGINLSGGQKQRVSLARAVYSCADVFFLDDPLSAVDSHVGKHIFDQVIGPEGLLKGKTRVLVTHGISFLPKVDNIFVFKMGKMTESGSFQALLGNAGAFSEFLKVYFMDQKDSLTEDELNLNKELFRQVSEIIEEDVEQYVRQRSQSVSSRKKLDLPDNVSIKSAKSTTSLHQIQPAKSLEVITAEDMKDSDGEVLKSTNHIDEKLPSDKEEKANEESKDKLIQKETTKEGQVQLSVFKSYLDAMGWVPAAVVMFLYVAEQGLAMGSNIWLGKWSDNSEAFNTTESRSRNLGIYSAFGLGGGLIAMVSALILCVGSLYASRGLHNSLLTSILRCPMMFFDTTPTGRILNRFTKDIDVLDTAIPSNLRSFVWCGLSVLSTLVIICISTPWFLIVVVPLGILYFFIQRIYVATSRQLKRIESVNLSPIYSHFDESIHGVATIRAFGKQDQFINESLSRIDKHQRAYYLNIVANRWVAIRLELVGTLVVLAAVLLAVISRNMDVKSLTAGTVGLSITYALMVTNTLNWMVRMSGELESNVVAVERIKEYVELPSEAEWIISINRPPNNWPSHGNIVFDSYSVRYREGLSLVLKGITCNIKGGEKVGIVGRTGAGKSSLTLSLFRLLEGAEGAIYIDDVRIGAIGLHDLRKALTIIPQDPVIFSGTLRMNLDPFEQYTDDSIWKALEQSNLKEFVQSLTEGLSYVCSEGGGNLSVGQRQLMCLSRALLRHTKVLILDEATAAVDLETDDLIQSTIRTAFADCTVLTIAHRINTIMDYDRIMVLDAGEVKEFSPPQELLANEQSIFYSLAKQANLVS